MALSDRLAKEIAEGKANALMKAIAAEIASDPNLRALLVQAVLREVATKEDIARLEEKLDRKIESVRIELDRKIEDLRRDFSSLMKWMIGLMASMWISIVVGIIVALMKLG